MENLTLGKAYKIGHNIGVFVGTDRENPSTAQFIMKQPHNFEEYNGYVVFDITKIRDDNGTIRAVSEPEPEDLHETQKKQILDYLKTGKSITKLEALKMFGCWNSGDIIFKLRNEFKRNNEKLSIKTDMITNGKKRFASYKLIENGN